MLVNPLKLVNDGYKSFGKGLFETQFGFNGDFDLWGHNDFKRSFFNVFGNNWLSYGVVDSPEQFSRDCAEIFEKYPHPIVVLFTHVPKDPENAGKGGGWRWHKWGAYLGHGNPSCEHLDDEEGFNDGVWCFHAYIVDNLPYEV